MNGRRSLNMLSNQEESPILNKNALLWLFAYSPKSRGGQLLFTHPIVSKERSRWLLSGFGPRNNKGLFARLMLEISFELPDPWIQKGIWCWVILQWYTRDKNWYNAC
jgi:hypothetical protein